MNDNKQNRHLPHDLAQMQSVPLEKDLEKTPSFLQKVFNMKK